MAVVTLTGHLGSMGTIAAQVAQALGYVLADRELLAEAAQALGWSEEEVQEFDERTRGQGSRLARLLRDFIERASLADLDAEGVGMLVSSTYGDMAVATMRPRDERYIAVLSAFIRDLAERGNAVIVGRGAQALLADREGALHVRVVCDLDERIRRIAERDGMTEQAARARVEDSDRQREAWHRKYFGINYQSPYLYDLVLNSGRLSDEQAAKLIAQLVQTAGFGADRNVGRAGKADVPGAGARAPAEARVRQDWGWMELRESGSGGVAARGHLFAAQGATEGSWQGELESIHLTPGRPSLHAGTYFARFGRSSSDHVVDIELTDRGWLVHSTDAEVPAIFRERSEG